MEKCNEREMCMFKDVTIDDVYEEMKGKSGE